MYYYSKHSDKKIIHMNECLHITKSYIDCIGWFENLSEAYEQGYRLCKHCSPIEKLCRTDRQEIINFCANNGLSLYKGNKSISVMSTLSEWKITVDDANKAVLYHKNTFKTEKDHLSKIEGYHWQRDILKDNVLDYLGYIVEHDYFRMFNPVHYRSKNTEIKPPRIGTRRYKKTQRRKEKIERRNAIRNVLNLIDSLNASSAVPAM